MVIFFRLIRIWKVTSIFTLSAVLIYSGCGNGADEENRKDLESGRIDSLILELLPKKVRIDRFSIRVPDDFSVDKRGKDYAEKRGEMSIGLEGANSSSVLIYRRPVPEPLEIRGFMLLIDEIDRNAYGMETKGRSYKKMRLNDIPVLLVEGYWYDDDGEEFPLRVAGFECGSDLYIVQSVIKCEPGGWDPLPWSITKTFRCESE